MDFLLTISAAQPKGLAIRLSKNRGVGGLTPALFLFLRPIITRKKTTGNPGQEFTQNQNRRSNHVIFFLHSLSPIVVTDKLGAFIF